MLLKTLAHYNDSIEGALQINGLPDIGNSHPTGALILVATAVSRKFPSVQVSNKSRLVQPYLEQLL